MSATGTCPQGLPVETVGPYFEAYTTEYSNSFLAYGTLEIEGPGCNEDVIVGGFHTIDFSNLYYNPISPTTTYKSGCAPYVNPRVSMALDLTAAVPAWASCQPLYYGAFDPPSILRKESQLAPPANGPGPVTNVEPATPTASPAEAPAAPTPNDSAPTHTPAPALAPSSRQSAPQSAPAPAAPVNTPPNPPADPISAPGNPAAQSNPIPPNAPGNSPAAPPTKPQDPAPNEPKAYPTDTGQPTPGNTQYNPNNLSPEQVAALDQALGNNNPEPHNPAPNDSTPNNPAPTNPASKIPAPNDPAPTNPAPNAPAPNNPAPNNAVPAPIPLQTIPSNTPAPGGDPAPQATTQLQALPINPPQNPGRPQNNVENPSTGGNGNVSPPQPAAANNGPPQPGQQPGPNFPAAAPAVALPIATAPVYLGTTQPLAIGGQAVQKAPDGGLLIGGQSLTQGSQATLAGQAVSVGASNVAIGSSIYALPAAAGPNPVALETPAPLSIGGQAAQYAPGPNGGLLIAGQTIAAGQQATVSGSVISVGASALNIGGSTYALPAPTAATTFGQSGPPAVGGQAIQQAPGGGVIIAGQTIAQGSQATIQGTVISVGSSGLAIGSNNYAFPVATAPPAVGGQPVLQAPGGGVIVAGQTIAQGSQATVQGTTVSVCPSGVIIAGTTYAIPAPTLAGQPVQQAPDGAVVVAGQTVPPGSQITISNTIISVNPTGIIIAGSSYTIPTPTSPSPLEYIPLPLSIGNVPITQLPNSFLLIGSQTLTPGITTTISGTAITLGTGNVVLDSSTFFLPSLTVSASAPLQTPAPLLIAGTYASEAPNGGIIVAGTTILPGNQTTISGTIISIPPTGSAVIVDGVSHPILNPTHPPPIRTTLAPASGNVTGLPAVSEKAAVAGIIYSALGSNGSAGNATKFRASIGAGGFTAPSGTAGVDVYMPTTFTNGGGGGRSEVVGLGLRGYGKSAFVVFVAVVAVSVGMVGMGVR